MKNFSSDLMALLQRNTAVWGNIAFDELNIVDLIAIGPALNGQMIYATNGTLPILYNGNWYDPVSTGNWQRGGIESRLGLEASTMKLSVTSGQMNPISFPGTPALMADAIKYGLLDGAVVTVLTAYMPTYGQLYGPTGGSLLETKFVGEISSVDKNGLTQTEMTVSDLRYLMNVDCPSRLVSPNCWWVLYSTGCSLSKANFSRTGAVAGMTNNNTLVTAAHLAPISPAGTFTQGYLVWTSGSNQGLANYIHAWTPGSGSDSIQLDVAPLFPVNLGDTFTIYQGCNHTFASCTDLQGAANSLVNFGGQPNVPVPETAL